MVGVLVTVWLERKISAAVQQRIGLNMQVLSAFFSPLLMASSFWWEDIIPARADGLLLGPVLVVVPVVLSWLIVPFGQNLLVNNVGWHLPPIPSVCSAHRSADEWLCSTTSTPSSD